jgi:hypothetical protein
MRADDPRTIALTIDALLRIVAETAAAVEKVPIEETLDDIWDLFICGRLRLVPGVAEGEFLGIEPCGSERAERRAVRDANRRLLKCRA